MLTTALNAWRRRCTRNRLTALLERIAGVTDEVQRVRIINEVSARLLVLEADGVITPADRAAMAQDWVRQYARHRVAGSYREGDPREVARWGGFLTKAG